MLYPLNLIQTLELVFKKHKFLKFLCLAAIYIVSFIDAFLEPGKMTINTFS